MTKDNYKRGLILEGGAMRGLFTAGILDVFMENGITFDGIAGISAGAIFGCNLKSHQIGRALRYNTKFSRDPRYCSLRSLIFTGDYYGVKFCYEDIPFKLDLFDTDTFGKDPAEFWVGATDADTGKPVYHLCRDGKRKDMKWIRASGSLPLVSRAVNIGGHRLLDGGMSDSVPFEFMEKRGYNRNVIILTRPDGYTKEPVSGGMKLLLKLGMRKYPKAAETMFARSEMYNRQMQEIKKREAEGSVLVIRPYEDLNISRTERDPAELERVCRIGRQVGADRLAEVKDFLGEQR
ncbi:Predicted phospholipase, patatin/cPLA2 family [Ruminococcaceae bacterium FB2012]|nr:Predicted phospholipase, patatin/cPLA2 family [Ruminococcaceae bacterium FB2012]